MTDLTLKIMTNAIFITLGLGAIIFPQEGSKIVAVMCIIALAGLSIFSSAMANYRYGKNAKRLIALHRATLKKFYGK